MPFHETLSESYFTPEQRVFGYGFRVNTGVIGHKEFERTYNERYIESHQGKLVWVPMPPEIQQESDGGLAAYLYWKRQIIAIVNHDYQTGLSDLYLCEEVGKYPDRIACAQVSFDNAVNGAEEYAEVLGAFKQ